ncbi:MAG: hypothetical protein KIS76_11845 [Pyrinomonadaceae bacterium]|nr:hypothetical protein [Pyrinomonadaceae bacterium]
MKRIILLIIAVAAFSSISAFAQDEDFASTRLTNLATQLKRQTVDLSDRTYDDIRRSRSNGRREIDAAFLAQQFDASAGLFQQMVRDNRYATELRDAAAILSDIARRAPTFGANGNLWREAGETVDDIQRELGVRGNPGGNDGGNRSGRAFWRGTVDNKVQLIIRGRNIETRTVEGRAYPAGSFSFTSNLPNRDVDIEVTKKDGRGRVTIVQQPKRRNDYTAIVEIHDDGSGARQYQIEITW